MAEAAARRLLGALLVVAGAAAADAAAAPTAACRLKGIDREVQCGTVAVAEDPERPDGRRIDVHFAVVPAVARARALEPVYVFAGGPGQSARRAAARVQPLFARLNARRDIVYVDQRGTGGSNALACDDDRAAPTRSLAESLDAARLAAHSRDCLRRLAAQHDLRQYATWIAVRDIDAVRAALGHERINLWGASYGTRAALEYLRQFPRHVRSVVLDGVAPPDMALPASFAVDAQASLQALFAACATMADCGSRYPALDAALSRLLARADGDGIAATVAHPFTGRPESVRIDRATLAALLRTPLYVPSLAAVLPYALAEAEHDNLAPLLALAVALGGRVGEDFAEGMHFAVVCAEDLPRVDAAARAAATASPLGKTFLTLYDDLCAAVPRRAVPPAFYTLSEADVPVLILSGGADPATPPRHGERVAARLRRATHVVAPHLAHGVSQQGCAPELIGAFIRQGSADGLDTACLQRLPAPTFFAAPGGSAP